MFPSHVACYPPLSKKPAWVLTLKTLYKVRGGCVLVVPDRSDRAGFSADLVDAHRIVCVRVRLGCWRRRTVDPSAKLLVCRFFFCGVRSIGSKFLPSLAKKNMTKKGRLSSLELKKEHPLKSSSVAVFVDVFVVVLFRFGSFCFVLFVFLP